MNYEEMNWDVNILGSFSKKNHSQEEELKKKSFDSNLVLKIGTKSTS